jgi:2-keto-4-pentenoate hydratase
MATTNEGPQERSVERTTGEIPPYDQRRMRDASEILLRARCTVTPITELPADLRPKTIEEAYHLQDLIVEELGAVAGWKVGVSSPDGEPLFAPMASYGVAKSGWLIANKFRRLRGVEAEIAFLMGKDLPPRSTRYTRDEVVAAIASCHPAIELIESGFFDPDKVDRLSMIGDLQIHGGFVYGAPMSGWESFDFSQETVALIVNGRTEIENGSNAAGGDLLRLVEWLANAAQQRTGGLEEGQWITTGSWTGKTLLKRGDSAEAKFGHFGNARVRFE